MTEYAIKVSNEKDGNGVLDILASKGYRWSGDEVDSEYINKRYPYPYVIYFYGQGNSVFLSYSNEDYLIRNLQVYKVVSLQDFRKMFGVAPKQINALALLRFRK